jgi:hypothetical protein
LGIDYNKRQAAIVPVELNVIAGRTAGASAASPSEATRLLASTPMRGNAAASSEPIKRRPHARRRACRDLALIDPAPIVARVLRRTGAVRH